MSAPQAVHFQLVVADREAGFIDLFNRSEDYRKLLMTSLNYG